MSKPLMLLSLPSSGTDWLADLIAELPGVDYYHKEFFNPITNNTDFWLLSPHFGCEAASCIHNIARKAPDSALEMVTQRFNSLGHTFTKENFLFWNVPGLVDRFNVFFLHKRADNTFPPTRARVYSWYDAIAHSIEENVGHRFTTASLHKRAVAVHDYCWSEVALPNAKRYELPVLSYELLMDGTPDAVLAELSRVFSGAQLQQLTSRVIATRRGLSTREGVVPA